MKCPTLLSHQYAAFADCPAGSIAALSFIATPITFALKSVATRSMSPIVVAVIFLGDSSPARPSLPTLFTVWSEQQYVNRPSM